ncbi:MAG: S9 family peptidase [Candidatus Atribacteria bacterium]|nr:S9 family peptidase [Candidatus Atribacteria bacterium]
MKTNTFNCLFLAFILFCLIGFGNLEIAYSEEIPLIPLRDFFRNPEKIGYSLSPNGEYFAYVAPWENRLNIFVQKFGETEAKRITSVTDRDLAGYFWASNHRIIYVRDQAGEENYHLFSVNIDGSNPVDLTPFEGVRAGVIDDLKDNDQEMIISLNMRDPRFFDAYRINIETGEMKIIAENPGNVVGWLTDHNGWLRVAITSDGVNTSILYRENESQSFENILTTDFKETLTPFFFTYDNKNLYALSNLGRDKTALVVFDPKTKKENELIYENPDVDVNSVLASDKKKKLTAVTYITDKLQYYFFDEDTKAIFQDLSKKIPGYELVVTSSNRDENRFIIRSYSDKSLGAYYLYDYEKNEIKKIVDVSPWIQEENMADMKPVSYPSRDGFIIHGYLTLPRGIEPKNLPVIINPHGGPWYRDSWGYNAEVQFLANRGYAVLQMNFRGSTGYGRKFWEAGFKQWGKKMQDDITDGVVWLINQGIADPKRIGIYGGSYGGYATLAGITLTPDLYAAAVDYVGISNIFTFLEAIPPYWEPLRQQFYEMIGDPVKDKELLESVSPVFLVDRIKTPLFIAQGANDPRVKKSESDQIVAALEKRGISVQYMVKENEGHGFANEENRFDFYRAMEEFLSVHLGGKVGP